MNIGVVSTLFPSSSMPADGIFVKEELDALNSYVSVRLLSPQPNRIWLKNLNADIPDVSYPVKRPFTFAFPRFFKQHWYPASLSMTLKTHASFLSGCDLIHAHNAFPEAVAAVRAFGKKLPVVVTVHGSDVNYFAQKPAMQADIIDALNSAAAVICVSARLKNTLAGLGVRREMTVIHNGINDRILLPQDKAVSCKKTGLDSARPRILFAGNFVEVKGIEYLIRAFPKVLDNYPECELVLLGAQPGPHDRKRYRYEIEKAGIEKSVTIQDRVPHDMLSHWINSSDLLVLPSHNEGFGLVLAEALACGKPVVSTLSGGPEDIVIPGSGILVEPGDVDALGEALLTVLNREGIDEPETLVNYAVKRFSYPTIARSIADVYTSVLREKLADKL